MFNSKSLVVGLLAVVAVLAGANFQVLANHTANVSVYIYYVRVLADTDPGPFQGCSDVYVKAKVTSSTGQVREKKTNTITKCPVGNIFVGKLLNLTDTSTNKITTGPFTFQYWVKDDDDGPFNSDDTMNGGSQFNVACNGLWQTFTDFAGAGDAADIQTGVRCAPIAHAGGASEQHRVQALSASSGNSETLKIELFDIGGRKVYESGTSENLETLAARAQGRLANGVYLYVQTVNVDGQLQKKLGKAVVLPSGHVQVFPSQEPKASRDSALGNQVIPQSHNTCVLMPVVGGESTAESTALNAIRSRFPLSFSFRVNLGIGHPRYTVRVSNPRNLDIVCERSEISLDFDVRATTPSWYAPNFSGTGRITGHYTVALGASDVQICVNNLRLSRLDLRHVPGIIDSFIRNQINASGLIGDFCVNLPLPG